MVAKEVERMSEERWKSFIRTLKALDPSHKGVEFNRVRWTPMIDLKVKSYLKFKLTQWKHEWDCFH